MGKEYTHTINVITSGNYQEETEKFLNKIKNDLHVYFENENAKVKVNVFNKTFSSLNELMKE